MSMDWFKAIKGKLQALPSWLLGNCQLVKMFHPSQDGIYIYDMSRFFVCFSWLVVYLPL